MSFKAFTSTRAARSAEVTLHRCQRVQPFALPPTSKPCSSNAAHLAQPLTSGPALFAAVATLLSSAPALAAEAPELFANKCAGCHLNGGNVLAVGATLFPEDLRKNGYDSPEALYRIIYSGKGKMPGFGKDCAPKGACTFGPRLSDEEVSGLAVFVQERAAAGWKQQQ